MGHAQRLLDQFLQQPSEQDSIECLKRRTDSQCMTVFHCCLFSAQLPLLCLLLAQQLVLFRTFLKFREHIKWGNKKLNLTIKYSPAFSSILDATSVLFNTLPVTSIGGTRLFVKTPIRARRIAKMPLIFAGQQNSSENRFSITFVWSEKVASFFWVLVTLEITSQTHAPSLKRTSLLHSDQPPTCFWWVVRVRPRGWNSGMSERWCDRFGLMFCSRTI